MSRMDGADAVTHPDKNSLVKRQWKPSEWIVPLSTSLCLHLLMLGTLTAWHSRPRVTMWVNLLEVRLLSPHAQDREVRPVADAPPTRQRQKSSPLTGQPFSAQSKTPVATRHDLPATVPQATTAAVPGGEVAGAESTAAETDVIAPRAPLPAASTVATDPLPGPTETVEQRYLREQFTYIRERVMTRLVYPPLARRQGWTGLVKVSFTVCVDGTIEELQIVASSGRALLDQQALRAVQAAVPFPAPPVRASIILPVLFTVETSSR